MKESSLHISIKNMYTNQGDQQEQVVSKYQIDIVNDHELIEIQTGNFSNLKKKLNDLLSNNVVRVIYPLPIERWIVRRNQQNQFISRRKSPKKGQILDIFNEIIYILPSVTHLNLIFEVILINDELIFVDDGKGSWRRKGWSIFDRKLLEIHKTLLFEKPSDFLNLIINNISGEFTTKQLAKRCGIKNRLAQRVTYCLYQMGELERTGKEGNAWIYQRK